MGGQRGVGRCTVGTHKKGQLLSRAAPLRVYRPSAMALRMKVTNISPLACSGWMATLPAFPGGGWIPQPTGPLPATLRHSALFDCT